MIGWIVRSTPGALVTYFALILVLPVFGNLFGSWGTHVAEFLPSAGGAFADPCPNHHTCPRWADSSWSWRGSPPVCAVASA